MKFRIYTLFLYTLTAIITFSIHAAEITGAGATFPAPIYAKWADSYQKATGNNINYQPIGSGGGIKQIKAKTVDFGASDMPLKPEELAKENLVQFPAVIGGVVVVHNLSNIKPGEMRLTPTVLSDIYLGKITKWNDSAIISLNPKLKLPDQPIAVVRRADGSGTTFLFTNYLAKVSPEWQTKVGEGSAVQWPVGLGGKGNEGVAAFVQRISGAIGYVEFAYALSNKMSHILLENAAGSYPVPKIESFKAAAAYANWNKSGFYTILTNETGNNSWPITGATFILMHKIQNNPQQGVAVLKFFDWAYRNGAKLAEELHYIPLPNDLVNLIRASWGEITDQAGNPIFN